MHHGSPQQKLDVWGEKQSLNHIVTGSSSNQKKVGINSVFKILANQTVTPAMLLGFRVREMGRP
jgi:hypothetical protein